MIEIAELGIDINRRLEILEVNEPPERKPGIKVENVESLVDKLKNEARYYENLRVVFDMTIKT